MLIMFILPTRESAMMPFNTWQDEMKHVEKGLTYLDLQGVSNGGRLVV